MPGPQTDDAGKTHRQTSDALRASELRYRRLFEAAQDGILIINEGSGQIEDANPYLTQMLGFSHAELLGKKLWDVGAFVDVIKSTEMFERLKAEGYVRYSDLPLKTRSGDLISVEFVSNVYDCSGVRVIQCNIRNITAQRQAEDQVRKLSLVVEQSPVEITIADLAGDIEYVNAALLRSTGYRQDELLGRPARMLQSDATDPLTMAQLHAASANGAVWRGEVRSRRSDGSDYDASAVFAPIRSPDGSLSHHVLITEDITERKRDALELDRHRHALQALVEARTHELAVATLAAEAANVAKSAFLANMSHEIRTPLGAITGLAYLIQRTPLTAQQADWLAKVEVASAHLLELINAVLDMSKIEAGKLALDVNALDIGSIATCVVSMLSEQAAAKQVLLTVEPHPLPPGLMGDAARVRQALLNLAGNAVKFTAAGAVTLRTLCLDEDADTALLRFEVQDSGAGIAPQVLARLFVQFEQGDSSLAREHGGTGLGLAIVRQLARLMGGDAGAKSTPGIGSTFWFTGRLHKAAGTHLGQGAQPSSAEASLLREHGRARVLVVEDDPVNRMVATELLRTVFGTVDAARDGIEAVRLAGCTTYDVILMDLQMSAMGGLDATRAIRLLPCGRDTTIVALTANAFAEDRAACLAAGMDDFLAKPVKIEALLETMHRGLSRRRRRPASVQQGTSGAGP